MKSAYFSMPNGLLKNTDSILPADQIPFKEEFIKTGNKNVTVPDNFLKSADELDEELRLNKNELLTKTFSNNE